MIATGGAVLLAVAIAAGAIELTGNGATGLARLAPNSVGVINPNTNRIVAQIPLGTAPTAITYGDGAIWTANTADSTVTRIDPKTRRVVKTIAVPRPAKRPRDHRKQPLGATTSTIGVRGQQRL